MKSPLRCFNHSLQVLVYIMRLHLLDGLLFYIICLLNLDNSCSKFVLLHDLLNGDVLEDVLRVKNGLDVWSQGRLSSGNSVDDHVLNDIDDSCLLAAATVLVVVEVITIGS